MSAASSVPQRLRRVVFLLVIPALALCALALAGNARADGSTLPPDPSAAAPSVTAQDSSSATTDQGALASANATQQQPSNVVNSTRVDSPGDNGAIAQANTAQGQAAAANGSATTQAGGSPSSTSGGEGDQGTEIAAATQQAAAAIASAIQQGAQNIVIQIRINSPGDNGPISQSNIANAGAGAVNASQTSQGSGAGAAVPAQDGSAPDSASPASGAAPPAAPAEPPASAPPAELRQAYSTTAPARPRPAEAAAGPRQANATTTPARPLVESPQKREEHAAATGSTRPPAAGAHRGQLQVAPAQAVPTRVAAAPVSTIDPQHPASPTAAPKHHGAAVAASGGGGAARVFNRIAGSAPVAAESLDQVSNAVVLTLVALIVGVLFFVAYTYAPPALRASGLWLRLRP
jgi:hypothetical protein